MLAQQTESPNSPESEVLALLTGQAKVFRGPYEWSAIAKSPVSGAVAITPLGLSGDDQANRVFHGGPDKALHHYPFDHYSFWRHELGDHPLLAQPGGFGENVSTLGFTEETVWLGDRFRLGTALIEVSHGRQPCWKLAHRFGVAKLTAQVVQTGRAGWYYRVLEPGHAAAGDRLTLVERGLAEWPLAQLFAVLIGDKSRREPATLRDLAALPVLAEAWRLRARELLG
ncbi:MAG: MOSC domain-containing protein [Pseudomonadota bacterium]|nr:MOSC domain-containing protein [Pseudomonadota bacterium]